ncbi:MAG: DUF3822 family protein [Maribacter sp.]|nr:DUF3822 family protein [Maribacter sp.]
MTKKKINKEEDNSLDNYNKLSIQVSLNGLSFCVLDTIGNRILKSDRLVFEKNLSPLELRENLEQLVKMHKLDSSHFSEVVVVHSNNLFSLVPKSLFDAEELANYLKFNTKILANDHIAYDELNNYDIVTVYVPFVNINNYVFDLFGEFEYKHNGTVLVEALMQNSGASKEAVCYVHIEGQQMDITIIAQKKLLLYNSFTITTKEDFIYYLLFTLEQLKLDTERIKLQLFGSIEKGDDIYNLCYKYIKDVSLFIPSAVNFPKVNADQKSLDFTVLSAL